MNDDEKSQIITISTNIFALIFGISLFFYILIIILKVQLPYVIMDLPGGTEGVPLYKNYLFLVVPMHSDLIQYRFCSIFLEPSIVGNYSALIIYINHYEFKRKNVFIILLALLFSISLAGYILLVIGYIIHSLLDGKHFYTKLAMIILLSLFFVGVGYYIYMEFPDSLVSKLVISRLQVDKNKGISGNNRNNDAFNYQYSRFIESDDYLFGIGSRYIEEMVRGRNANSASYKTFIFINGLIGVILLCFLYFFIFYSEKTKFLFGLLILKVIGFLQYPYAMWEMELFLFIGAGCFFKMKSNKKIFSRHL
jgi:hypothetical protein